jgi:hypothetical protein
MINRLMRFLLRSLIVGFALFGNPLIAQDAFTAFAGTYQGLLVEDPGNDPAGKIDFTVTSKGALSGSLLFKNQKSYKFKSQLSQDAGSAKLTNFDVVKPKEGLQLKLSLTIADDGSFVVDGNALLPGFAGDFVEKEGSASRLRFYKAKTDDCPWTGVFSMAFHDPVKQGGDEPPGGSIIGSATVKPDGVMSVKGSLADGTKFTASARPSADGGYRFFFGGYKTVGSYFTAIFRLTDRGDGQFQVAVDQGSARWVKVRNDKDKSYRLGFDVSLSVSVVQWKVPGKGETLAGLLGLQPSQAFEFALDYDFDDARTPTMLSLDAKNQLVIRQGGAGSPSLLTKAADWKKIFTGKIDPKTGLLTATLNLEDKVGGKTVKRKVTISGILTQPAVVGASAFAFGYVLVPPLDSKTGTLVSAATEFIGPFVEDPLVLEAGPLAGTYTGTFNRQPIIPPFSYPAQMPAHNSTVTFTVSPDLKTVVFAGRTLPLSGDSRPVALVYVDSKTKPIVTLNLYITGGVITGFGGQYIQSGTVVGMFTSKDGTVTKQ